MSFVSGPYDWFYNGHRIGIVQDAPEVRLSSSAEPIVGDNLGDTVQAVINRGGSAFLDMVMQEFDQEGARQAFWPYSQNVGTIETGVTNPGSYSPIGCVMPSKRLLATKVPFSCATPANWLAARALLAPGFQLNFSLGSRLRNVPISFMLLPWVDSLTSGASSLSGLAGWTTSITHAAGTVVVAADPADPLSVYQYTADSDRPDTIAAFDAAEAANWTKGAAVAVTQYRDYAINDGKTKFIAGFN